MEYIQKAAQSEPHPLWGMFGFGERSHYLGQANKIASKQYRQQRQILAQQMRQRRRDMDRQMRLYTKRVWQDPTLKKYEQQAEYYKRHGYEKGVEQAQHQHQFYKLRLEKQVKEEWKRQKRGLYEQASQQRIQLRQQHRTAIGQVARQFQAARKQQLGRLQGGGGGHGG